MKSPIRKRTRSASIDSVSMTPMIDVVFQLLIYFVLTSEESKHRDLVSLLDRLSKAGLTQVSLLSTQ
jgi:biopolymer transport protein ExbD